MDTGTQKHPYPGYTTQELTDRINAMLNGWNPAQTPVWVVSETVRKMQEEINRRAAQ